MVPPLQTGPWFQATGRASVSSGGITRSVVAVGWHSAVFASPGPGTVLQCSWEFADPPGGEHDRRRRGTRPDLPGRHRMPVGIGEPDAAETAKSAGPASGVPEHERCVALPRARAAGHQGAGELAGVTAVHAAPAGGGSGSGRRSRAARRRRWRAAGRGHGRRSGGGRRRGRGRGTAIRGSTSTSAPSSATGPAAVTSSRGSATTSSSRSGPTTRATATSGGSSVDRCHTSELTGSLAAGSPGAGQRYATLVLRNTGGRTCTLHGFGGLGLAAADGHALPTQQVRTGAARPRSCCPGRDRAVRAALERGYRPRGRDDRDVPADADDPAGDPAGRDRALSVAWTLGPVCSGGTIEQQRLHRLTRPMSERQPVVPDGRGAAIPPAQGSLASDMQPPRRPHTLGNRRTAMTRTSVFRRRARRARSPPSSSAAASPGRAGDGGVGPPLRRARAVLHGRPERAAEGGIPRGGPALRDRRADQHQQAAPARSAGTAGWRLLGAPGQGVPTDLRRVARHRRRRR